MTSELWAPPPTFDTGATVQYFSAAAHGNALVQCCDVLMGTYKGAFPIWQTGKAGASSFNEGWGRTADGWRIWSGAVRHKTHADTLVYAVRVWRSGVTKTLKVKAAGITKTHTVTAGSGYTDVTTTAATGIDVSGLADDSFYEVHIDIDADSGSIDSQVLYCHETDEQSYATLAGFVAGNVYTPAQWQTLSDRATILWQQQSEPVLALCGSYHSSDVTTAGQGEFDTGRWMMRWKNRYLAYQFWVKGGSGRHSTLVLVYVKDVLRLTLGQVVLAHEIDDSQTTIRLATIAAGDNIFLHDGDVVKFGAEQIKLDGLDATGAFADCTRGYHETPKAAHKNEGHIWQIDQDGKTYDPMPGYVMYRGVIDLGETGMTENELVEVYTQLVSIDHSDGRNDDYSSCQIDYLYQTSASEPYVPGWSSMPSFSHRSTVGGAGSIKTIRDNLAWLSTHITYRNPATPNLSRWGGWGVRQKRWIIYYYGDAEAQPEITYWRTNKEKETVALTSGKPNEWHSYDLDAAGGLWDGVAYRVTGVTFAFEDDVSV